MTSLPLFTKITPFCNHVRAQTSSWHGAAQLCVCVLGKRSNSAPLAFLPTSSQRFIRVGAGPLRRPPPTPVPQQSSWNPYRNRPGSGAGSSGGPGAGDGVVIIACMLQMPF